MLRPPSFAPDTERQPQMSERFKRNKSVPEGPIPGSQGREQQSRLSGQGNRFSICPAPITNRPMHRVSCKCEPCGSITGLCDDEAFKFSISWSHPGSPQKWPRTCAQVHPAAMATASEQV